MSRKKGSKEKNLEKQKYRREGVMPPLLYNSSYFDVSSSRFLLPLLTNGGFYESTVIAGWCVEAAAQCLNGGMSFISKAAQVLNRNCLNQGTRTQKMQLCKLRYARRGTTWMECGKQEQGGEGGQIREFFNTLSSSSINTICKSFAERGDVRASFSSINVCSVQTSVWCPHTVRVCVYVSLQNQLCLSGYRFSWTPKT